MNNLTKQVINLTKEAIEGNKESHNLLVKILDNIPVNSFDIFLLKNSHKSCVKNLLGLLKGQIKLDEYQVSLMVSSLLTHSLIELGENQNIFAELKIKEQVELLNNVIYGEVNTEDVINFYRSNVSLY